ncbi:MAG TPA: hypothetical protein VGF13_00235 [Verrucomicrobiae bacterium]|jgi:hypothetical protein
MALPKIQSYAPRTEMVGREITLANNEELTLDGISSHEKFYADHNVPPSCVRKEITIFLKPSTSGYVTLRNKRTKTLLAVIAASSSGGAVVIPTSCDVILKNKTGGTVTSTDTGANKDEIAVTETFFLERNQ